MKVYVCDCSGNDFDFRGKEHKADYKAIMDQAKKLGTVYSLQAFQEAINDEELFLDNAFILIR